MKYGLLVSGLLAILLTTFTTPLTAGESASVDQRAAAVRTEVNGLTTYNAYLALELANIAVAELTEHDKTGADEFIQAAEEAAAKAGGKQ
jgi:hypothetical protein